MSSTAEPPADDRVPEAAGPEAAGPEAAGPEAAAPGAPAPGPPAHAEPAPGAPAPGAPAPAAPARAESARETPAPDLERRRFFRAFSVDAIRTAASVIGATSAMQRESTAVAAELLGFPQARPAASSSARGGDAAFPAPYRLGEGVVRILDQRRLPGAVTEIECRTSEEVAHAMASMAARGGPLLGQLAAYAMALAAQQGAGWKPYPRAMILEGTADALRTARPDVAAVAAAVDRCLSAWLSFREPADGAEIAAAVRAVADAVASETNGALAQLSREGAATLPQPDERPLEILTIDATGRLSGGPAGTALGIVQAVAAAGRPAHVWVTETRPSRVGARLAAPELRAWGVPCTVIADGAAGWLLRNRQVDAILVGAERIAANGDFANAAGTYPLAVLAARHAVPLYVCAPLTAVDVKAADDTSLAVPMLPAADLLLVEGDPPPLREADALVPLDDITPAGLVTAYVTDQGVRQPPFGEPNPTPPA